MTEDTRTPPLTPSTQHPTPNPDMRVLVYDGPHRFHIERWPRPDPGAGEVRIRMAYVGICGSDLHGYTGESGRRLPGMVMGHEASGWVEAVGPGVTNPEDRHAGHVQSEPAVRRILRPRP